MAPHHFAHRRTARRSPPTRPGLTRRQMLVGSLGHRRRRRRGLVARRLRPAGVGERPPRARLLAPAQRRRRHQHGRPHRRGERARPRVRGHPDGAGLGGAVLHQAGHGERRRAVAPDVAIMHASRVAGYAPGGLLDPWDLDLLAEFGVDGVRLPRARLGEGRAGRQAVLDRPRLAPVHHDVQPRHRRAGRRARPRRPAGADRQSPDQFLEVARAMQARHRQARPVLRVPRRRRPDVAAVLHALQAARRRVRPAPARRAEVDHDAAVESLEFIQQLLDDTIARPSGDYGTAVAEFMSGESGMFFTGVWELPTARTRASRSTPSRSRRCTARRPPTPTRTRSRCRTSRARTRSSGGDATSSSPTSCRTRSAGPRPGTSRRTSRSCESAEYQALVPQAHYANAAEILNYDPEAWFTGSGSDFQNYFAETVQSVLPRRRRPGRGLRRLRRPRERAALQAEPGRDREGVDHVHRSFRRSPPARRRADAPRRSGRRTCRRDRTTASAGRSSPRSSSSSSMFLIWPLIHGFYLSFTGECITGAGGEPHRLRQLRRGAAATRSCGARCGNTLWFTVLSTDPAGARRAGHGAARAPGAAGPVAVAALVLHAVPAGLDRRRAVLDLDVQPAARPRQRHARGRRASSRSPGCRTRRGRCSRSSS